MAQKESKVQIIIAPSKQTKIEMHILVAIIASVSRGRQGGRLLFEFYISPRVPLVQQHQVWSLLYEELLNDVRYM